MQLSLPHSAAATVPGDAALAATLVQHNMPLSAVARASELPRHAVDQARYQKINCLHGKLLSLRMH